MAVFKLFQKVRAGVKRLDTASDMHADGRDEDLLNADGVEHAPVATAETNGCIDVPASLTADKLTDTVKFPGNPAGCG